MGSDFFGRVDMGLLGSPMGPLGLPGLISHFTLFIIKVVTYPLKHGMYGQQQNKEESLKLSLYMAFTSDVIWNLRNQILHNGGQANITATTRNIENRFQEFAYAMESEKPFRVEGDDNGE